MYKYMLDIIFQLWNHILVFKTVFNVSVTKKKKKYIYKFAKELMFLYLNEYPFTKWIYFLETFSFKCSFFSLKKTVKDITRTYFTQNYF